MGKQFELKTDHSGLKYLFVQPTLNVEESRWLEIFSEYDFDINHIKGKDNKVEYALNKRIHEMYTTTIIMYQSYFKDIILEAAKSDQKYMEVKENFQQGNLQQKSEEYKLGKDEIIMHKGIIDVPITHDFGRHDDVLIMVHSGSSLELSPEKSYFLLLPEI